MFKSKKSIDKTYGIIGLGRFGMALAVSLVKAGKEIIAMDYDEERTREIREYTENAYVVTKLDKKALEETGIANCDVVVICIGESIDTSILTTLNVIDLGVRRVIAKASTQDQGKVLQKIGAEVVYPERDMAVRLAQRLVSERLMNYFELYGNINLSELLLSKRVVGKTVAELDIRKKYGLNIIAVERGQQIITDILPDFVFGERDTVIVIGKEEKIREFEGSLEERE
ncbi:MAG: TrkA family potassium uptake protein [Lachnospiraceae bacterium]|nr:TrkA family potassium uptake protein [Lachnospiraceae bacterium]